MRNTTSDYSCMNYLACVCKRMTDLLRWSNNCWYFYQFLNSNANEKVKLRDQVERPREGTKLRLRDQGERPRWGTTLRDQVEGPCWGTMLRDQVKGPSWDWGTKLRDQVEGQSWDWGTKLIDVSWSCSRHTMSLSPVGWCIPVMLQTHHGPLTSWLMYLGHAPDTWASHQLIYVS